MISITFEGGDGVKNPELMRIPKYFQADIEYGCIGNPGNYQRCDITINAYDMNDNLLSIPRIFIYVGSPDSNDIHGLLYIEDNKKVIHEIPYVFSNVSKFYYFLPSVFTTMNWNKSDTFDINDNTYPVSLPISGKLAHMQIVFNDPTLKLSKLELIIDPNISKYGRASAEIYMDNNPNLENKVLSANSELVSEIITISAE